MNKVLFLGSVMAPAIAFTQQKPNIVFIMTDDLGWSDCGCYGNPFNETPNIDALAKTGIRFTNAYASAPVSSPSRAAMLTGKYPARLQFTNFMHGNRKDALSPVLPAQFNSYLSPKEITIAELLRDNDYATGHVGKWHIGFHDTCAPWSQGFTYSRIGGGDYYCNSYYEDGWQVGHKDTNKYYLTDKQTEQGIDFIRMNKGKPFFLYLAYQAPHIPIVPRGDKVPKYLAKYEKYHGKYNPYYAALVESIDDGVGEIVKALKAEGLFENTLIIFTSDNGGVGLPEGGPSPTSCEPLRKWKGHIYEGGIRVPAIIVWQGTIKQGQTCEAPFSNVDFLPTFCELAGIKKLPADVDGKSISQLLKNPSDPKYNRGPIYWHYPHFSNQEGRPAGGMRLGDFKLVENYETNKLELYNLKDDISESNDLSAKMPDKTKEMYDMFVKWRKSVNAQMPLPNPDYKK